MVPQSNARFRCRIRTWIVASCAVGSCLATALVILFSLSSPHLPANTDPSQGFDVTAKSRPQLPKVSSDPSPIKPPRNNQFTAGMQPRGQDGRFVPATPRFPVDKSLSRERTTEHLHIYSDLSEGDLDFYAKFFERFIIYFRENYLPFSQERPLTMYLFGDMQSYLSYSERQKAPRTPYGYWLAEFNVIVVNLKTGVGTATHELVHHLVYKGFVKPCPHWANEGIATFFEKFIGHVDDRGQLHISFGYFSNWRFPITKHEVDNISLGKLVRTPNDQCTARSLMLFLHKKRLFTQFIHELSLREDDPTGLITLIRIYGKDLPDLEKEWKDWIRLQPVDDNVLLVQRSFVKTQHDWDLWWEANKNRLYWDEEEHLYLVKGVEVKRLNGAGAVSPRR
jgi:hypothetical protein